MKKTLQSLPYFKILLFFITSLTFFICFYKLGSAYLDDWDEAWYGEMTKQMLQTKEFIVLQWNHGYLFDKPPLYIWITAAISSVFGLSELTVRITSAIAGSITIILAFVYSYRKWGILPGLLTFATLALNNIFIWRVRSGNLDALVTLLIFLTYFAVISKNKYRYLALALLFPAIYLTKISLVYFPILAFGFYEIVYKAIPYCLAQFRLYKQNKLNKPSVDGIYKSTLFTLINYVLLIAIGGVLIGGWLYAGKQQAGNEFVDYYLNRADQGVSKLEKANFKLDYWQYAYYSLQRRFFFVLVAGWLFMLIDLKKKENILLLGYSLFLLVMLTFTQRTNNWYLTPSIPFWSLIIGYATYKFMNILPKYRTWIIIFILVPSIYVSQKTFRENIIPIFNTSSSSSTATSAKAIKNMTKPGDTISRLDHLYPSTIYYSDRKVLASPDGANTSDLFISRQDLITRLEDGTIAAVVGKNGDIESFIKQNNLEGTVIKVNADEQIFRLIKKPEF